MDVTITLGWWLAPAAVTISAFAGMALWDRSQPRSSGYGAVTDGLLALIAYGAALIVSLVAWLFWAILT